MLPCRPPHGDGMRLAYRAAAHRKRDAEIKERKRARKQRAAIHTAMTEAARMKRSRKKGTTDLDANMMMLGFVPRVVDEDTQEAYSHAPHPKGAKGTRTRSDVLDKYERAT